jgi:acetolactate synthase-1/2/3 large subunit
MAGDKNFYSAADALNDALTKAGVTHVFVNLGTDYPPIIESWAKHRAEGMEMPSVIIAPHEYVAVSAAQGFAQITGKAQAVFVHVDVGTQNMGGALHNAYRCRVPVFILAGISPYTMEGELKGSRDMYIQFIQNVPDQAGIVRNYAKLCSELRTGRNTQQMVYRSLQIACSDPKGPVYMTAAREVLEEEAWQAAEGPENWLPVVPQGLSGASVEAVVSALMHSERPVVVTSYLGRNKEAVAELVKLCRLLAVPVVESTPSYMNYPADDELYLGDEAEIVTKADMILAIDCDLPWPNTMAPEPSCRVFYIDIDPVKDSIPLWHVRSERSMRADSFEALRQINSKLETMGIAEGAAASRREWAARLHALRAERAAIMSSPGEELTPDFVAACVREIIDDDTVLLNEVISDGAAVTRQIPRTKPGTYFFSGGSSLGWFGGAAVGMKLACPEKNVVALTSDGTYVFSCPTAVYWMARKYNAPFMTVIFNNSGWCAPKTVTKKQHPEGYAARTDCFWTSFDPSSRLDIVAEAAGGAFACTVERPSELLDALREGKEAVESGRCAVINAVLPKV